MQLNSLFHLRKNIGDGQKVIPTFFILRLLHLSALFLPGR